MDLYEAIRARHSVRKYTGEKISAQAASALHEEARACSLRHGVDARLIEDGAAAFDGFWAHYGKFSGVPSYFLLAGKPAPDLFERAGRAGARLVLAAQMLELNTCFAALSYKKSAVRPLPEQGEKTICVIAVGVGAEQGKPHRSKPLHKVCDAENMPDWFRRGMECALLAPTAMNQQKFYFSRSGSTVTARAGIGFYTKLDLGIVKHFFECGAGTENFTWG